MKKKEFLTLVKNVREDLKENIEEAIEKYQKAIRQLDGEYYDEAKKYLVEVLKDPKMASLVVEKALEENSISPLFDKEWDRGRKVNAKLIGVSLSAYLDLEDAPEYPKEKIDRLYNQLKTLLKLKREYRRMLDTWKLNAIENRTYNHEPFPLVLYELLSPELRKLLIPGE